MSEKAAAKWCAFIFAAVAGVVVFAFNALLSVPLDMAAGAGTLELVFMWLLLLGYMDLG